MPSTLSAVETGAFDRLRNPVPFESPYSQASRYSRQRCHPPELGIAGLDDRPFPHHRLPDYSRRRI